MDKRWRNLIIIFVVVVAVVLVYNSGALNNLFKSPEQQRVESYFLVMEQNDVNYADLRMALQSFEYYMSDALVGELSASAPDEYFRELVLFEKKQNDLMDNVEEFYSRSPNEICTESETAWNFYVDGLIIYDEMKKFLEIRNDLKIDADMTVGSLNSLGNAFTEYSEACAEIEAAKVMSP